MQLLACTSILAFSLSVYYIFGKAVCVRYHWNIEVPEIICVGFFLYFAIFQVIAEIMIFSRQKLHVLGNTWQIILILLLMMAASVLYSEKKANKQAPPQVAGEKRIKPSIGTRLLFALMIAAIVCECLTAVMLQRNIGWDFAYYMGNMTTSVATDTMYLYDGSSGILREQIEMRYALSSFYMNTAWLSQMTGISALVLQKYVMGVLGVLLTDMVAYSFAMEAFSKERAKGYIFVTITILLTVFWDVYDTSAQFLMLRNYEAKSYCANVVVPMVFYLLYRIWKDDTRMRNWAELFLVSFASVAISMSSLILVPALIVIMLGAHLLVSKRWNVALFRRSIYCLLPNLCYLLVYVLYSGGVLSMEV